MKIEPEQLEDIVQAWAEKVITHGMKRFRQAVKMALERCDGDKGSPIFPTIGVISGCLPDRDEAALTRVLADISCEKCGGSGWEKGQYGTLTDPQADSVRACQCRLEAIYLVKEGRFKMQRATTQAQATIARRAPECLAFRNALRQLAHRPLLTMEEHLRDTNGGRRRIDFEKDLEADGKAKGAGV